MTSFDTAETTRWTQPLGRTHATAAGEAGFRSLTAWIIAILPAAYLLVVAIFLSQGLGDPLTHSVIAACFYLAGVALAAVDEYVLRAAGQRMTPSPYWALLTSIPYLNARASADESSRSLVVLWVAIGVITVTGVVLGLMIAG